MRAQPQSLRQPVVLYAMLFAALIAATVLLFASHSLVYASRRAYRRAAKQELAALARTHSPESLREALKEPQSSADMRLSLVVRGAVSTSELEAARRAADGSPIDEVAVALTGPFEAYLMVRLDPSVPMAIAVVEIARMVPSVLVIALIFAGGLAFGLRRLLLPPLDALAVLAEATRTEDLQPVATNAPGEIAIVAERFQHTVRLLNEERERVEAQRDELEAMQTRLIRASKLASVGRLAAGIAHEVGNPLAAVQGYLALLQAGLEPKDEAEVLSRSRLEMERIHETIQKLLTYARLEPDHKAPLRPLALASEVQAVLELARGHPDIRRVALKLQLQDDAPKALARSAQLQQVLLNLVLNAAQATKHETQPVIEITEEASEDAIYLWVKDNGPGIDAGLTEQIFDPFYTTKEPGEGTGLGLAVSRSLIEAMEGTLEVAPSEGPGAVMQLRLLRAPTSEPTTSGPPSD